LDHYDNLYHIPVFRVLFPLIRNFFFQFLTDRQHTPDRPCVQWPVGFSTLGSPSHHRRHTFSLPGESRSFWLSLLRPVFPTLCRPLPLSSLKSDQFVGLPTQRARAALRSCPAWLQTVVESDGSPPGAGNSIGRVSPALPALPSSLSHSATTSATLQR
jgi:hypothetical protein